MILLQIVKIVGEFPYGYLEGLVLERSGTLITALRSSIVAMGSTITSADGTARAEIGEGSGDLAPPDLRPLLSFLRRPAFTPSAPARLSVRCWFGWTGLLLLVGVLGGELDRILVHAFLWPGPIRGAWAEFLKHPSWAAITAFLVAPALEELGFRAFLSVAPKFIFIGLTFFPAYLYLLILNDMAPITAPMSAGTVFSRFLHTFWVILPAGAINLLLYRYRRDVVLRFFRRRAVWIFWISCIVFAAGHNLLYTNSAVWWGFALVMPQFLVGVGLAYVRISFGLRWSVASHYMFDLLALLPSWLYFSASPRGPLHGLLPTFMAEATVLGVMACGLVPLWRVARFRW